MKKQEKQEKLTSQSRQKKIRHTVVWAAVLLLVAGSVWAMNRNNLLEKNNPDQDAAELLSAPRTPANLKGNPDAPVKLIEYSDFQCPACAYYQPFLAQLEQDLGEQLSIEYRHFPLVQIHPLARLAAQAAEAAARQGRFWEMHDMLYQRQADWSPLASGPAEEKFIEYAVQLELDPAEFSRDLNSTEIKDIVSQDEQDAYRLHLNGTPSFFLNGVKVKNPANYEEFRKIIESEINWNS